jgi:sugar phosphate isomerase/epimerase
MKHQQTDDVKVDASDTPTPAIESMSISDPATLTDPDPTRLLSWTYYARSAGRNSFKLLGLDTSSAQTLLHSVGRFCDFVSIHMHVQAGRLARRQRTTPSLRRRWLPSQLRRASRRAKRARLTIELEPESETHPGHQHLSQRRVRRDQDQD